MALQGKLTDSYVNQVDKPGRYGDGNGLYLVVKKSGRKSWILRITLDGKRTDLGLGSVKETPVGLARQKVQEFKGTHNQIKKDEQVRKTPENWRLFLTHVATKETRFILDQVASIPTIHPQQMLTSAFVLAKHGNVSQAREIFNKRYDEPRDRHVSPIHWQCELVLIGAHIRAYEDGLSTDADRQSLLWVLDHLPSNDMVGLGMAFNHLSLSAMQNGLLDQAQEYAQNAIRYYRRGNTNLVRYICMFT